MLQMAAAKAFGAGNFGKLDSLTVSMSPPDATTALLSGGGEINTRVQRAAVPASAAGKAGRHHGAQFLRRDGRPAHVHGGVDLGPVPQRQPDALQGAASRRCRRRPRSSTRTSGRRPNLWITDSKSKLALDFVDRIVSGPQVRWTMVPENTMKFAALHGDDRHAEGRAGVVARLFLSGDPRTWMGADQAAGDSAGEISHGSVTGCAHSALPMRS